MKCSNCNTENPNDAVYCWQCGGKLAVVQEPVRSKVTPLKEPQSPSKPKSEPNASPSIPTSSGSSYSNIFEEYILDPLHEANFYLKYGDSREKKGVWKIVGGLICYILAMISSPEFSGLLFIAGIILTVNGYKNYTYLSSYLKKRIGNILVLYSILTFIVIVACA